MYKLIFTPLLLIFSLDFVADDDKVNIEAGQTWLLESKSNRLSISNSEVLFFFSSDAYNTYQARRFSDWDQFSIVDGRDLVRLNTGDKIKMLSDPYLLFTKAIGAEVDRNAKGMGIRSNRYLMVIENFTILNIHVEKETKECGLTSAENLLNNLI